MIKTKFANGPYKGSNTLHLKDINRQAKVKIDQRMYGNSNCPTVVVFKTSNRSNAKTKMKVINKNIDYVLYS